ncbi:MAG: ABC transporter permease [Caldibacillus debilis]|uniref:ABC transporter permease n=1 Tax=Caldibacillus debilis TaxID=301148 RepID=UPI000E3939AD|nr:ABC transporter permease [Caldibacillus debilis]REJ13574.1 MAG: ABC transporter permease [Caldibacillus debilis]
MKIFQAFKIAYKSILSNKLRSVLTMLGIIIGVSAVIILVSLGKGASQSVAEEVAGLGSTLVSVTISGNSEDETVVGVEDIMAFKDLPGVEAVSPILSGAGTIAYGKTGSENVPVIGVTEAYLTVNDASLKAGRFIQGIDNNVRNKVIVLGSNVAEELFGFTDPVGQKVKIDGTSFQVIGVLAEQGDGLRGSPDDQAFIPLTTAERFFGQTYITSFNVKTVSETAADRVAGRIERTLYYKFGEDDSKYQVNTPSDVQEALSSVNNTMTLLLAGIAGISLIVGGIGIMNIMLVSVSERMREIGIRKAVGAKKSDILTQFLIEAAFLSGMGGILGVFAGIGGTEILSKLMDLTMAVSWWAAGVSFTISILIGILFGIFPANRAASLKPLDALRYE